jgi:hypothetical protein
MSTVHPIGFNYVCVCSLSRTTPGQAAPARLHAGRAFIADRN